MAKKKKNYIKFCSFSFSILSATPLEKIRTGTATPSFCLLLYYNLTAENVKDTSFILKSLIGLPEL